MTTSTTEKISEGDFVALLELESGDIFRVKVVGGRRINTGKGNFLLDDIVGKTFGETLKTAHGGVLKLLKSNFADKFSMIKRGPQIVTLKDAALVCAFCGIQSGDRVVEGGSGSGALTCFLANAVGPSGRVFSYDVRKDFFELARMNVKRLGLTERVSLKIADLYEGIEEKNVSAVILDVPEPWNVVEHALEALVPGGVLASYVPTVNQVERFVEALENQAGKFLLPPHTFETLLRDYKVRTGATRPEFRGLMHTGFITIVKKV